MVHSKDSCATEELHPLEAPVFHFIVSNRHQLPHSAPSGLGWASTSKHSSGNNQHPSAAIPWRWEPPSLRSSLHLQGSHLRLFWVAPVPGSHWVVTVTTWRRSAAGRRRVAQHLQRRCLPCTDSHGSPKVTLFNLMAVSALVYTLYIVNFTLL